MFFTFRKSGSEKIFSSAARLSKSTWTSRCGDDPPSMLLYTRTALTPEYFSQMSLPAPATYFSYSSSFPGRTSKRYSKVTMSFSFLFARPAGRSLPQERGDPLLSVGRHGVHRHDLLGVRVRFRLVEIDLRVEGLFADRHGQRARFRDPRGEFPGLGTQLARRDRVIDEPPIGRRLRIDSVGGQKHLEGALAADGAGERDHRGRAEESVRHPRSREPCLLGGDRQVAGRHELATRRRRDALDLGDHRLRDRLDLHHHLGA